VPKADRVERIQAYLSFECNVSKECSSVANESRLHWLVIWVFTASVLLNCVGHVWSYAMRRAASAYAHRTGSALFVLGNEAAQLAGKISDRGDDPARLQIAFDLGEPEPTWFSQERIRSACNASAHSDERLGSR
jgi:hypothetical protein